MSDRKETAATRQEEGPPRDDRILYGRAAGDCYLSYCEGRVFIWSRGSRAAGEKVLSLGTLLLRFREEFHWFYSNGFRERLLFRWGKYICTELGFLQGAAAAFRNKVVMHTNGWIAFVIYIMLI